MAKLTIDDFEEGVRAAFRHLGIRANSGAPLNSIQTLFYKADRSFRAADLAEALKSLEAKGEIVRKAGATDFYLLTDAGYAAL